MKYDFSGWATKANLRCSDGRTIMPGAFKDNDGDKVPLVWNHQHNDPSNFLGHALLEERPEGVYAYCTFNDTESGKNAKMLVEHGDIDALSIFANRLKQVGGNVMHGDIKEVSLVMAGANPGAYIESVMAHGEDCEDEAVIYTGENLCLYHSAEGKPAEDDPNETVGDVFNTLNEKQKRVVYALIGQALADNEDEDDDDEEEPNVKHNVFEGNEAYATDILCHSDQEQILSLAKQQGVGSLQEALAIYADDNELEHSAFGEEIEKLFPDYKDLRPGAPELITRDQSWVSSVMNGVRKTPFSRIRTRQMDVRDSVIRGRGYEGKNKKHLTYEELKGPKYTPDHYAKLVSRTTDPQTVYRFDELKRDDIIDITDFDVVDYQYGIMRQNLMEELATAILIGDGREDVDEEKISEDHIRSVLNDDEVYTLHKVVDLEAAKKELQGTNTGANFGNDYVYAEAIISAALHAREDYRGSGNLVFYCTPHLLNVMLLARDLNGRRIYDSVSDLARALNVSSIHTVEQFTGKQRKDKQSKMHNLLGIFIDWNDYDVGSTRGGQITKFEDFDIKFNKNQYSIQTRLSGALTRVASAIVLEEPDASLKPKSLAETDDEE